MWRLCTYIKRFASTVGIIHQTQEVTINKDTGNSRCTLSLRISTLNGSRVKLHRGKKKGRDFNILTCCAKRIKQVCRNSCRG
jgi:hypothetical protein